MATQDKSGARALSVHAVHEWCLRRIEQEPCGGRARHGDAHRRGIVRAPG